MSANATLCPQFMIAHVQLQPLREFCPEFTQAFQGAFTRCWIGGPDERRVAGVIAVRNQVIEIRTLFEKTIQPIILLERIAQPDETAMELKQQPDQSISPQPYRVIL